MEWPALLGSHNNDSTYYKQESISLQWHDSDAFFIL